MCGRARCVLSTEAIEENMTPGLCFPVLFENQKPAERTLQFMTWGLIPSFTGVHVKKLDFFKMFNARLETIDEKPSFQSIAKTNRCVVFLNGYFEWKLCSDTGRKQPYYVARRDSHPLCLAAVFDVWKSDTGAPLRSFSLITTPSSSSSEQGLRDLHPRQPVFLCSTAAVDSWLQGVTTTATATCSTGPTSTLLDVASVPTDLVIHPVTPLMSHATYQLEDCSQRVASPLKSKKMTDFFSRSPSKKPLPPSCLASSFSAAGAEGSSEGAPEAGRRSGSRDTSHFFSPGGAKKRPRTELERGEKLCSLSEEEQVQRAVAESLRDLPPPAP